MGAHSSVEMFVGVPRRSAIPQKKALAASLKMQRVPSEAPSHARVRQRAEL